MAGVQVISQAGAQVMLEGRPTENQYIAGQVMFLVRRRSGFLRIDVSAVRKECIVL